MKVIKENIETLFLKTNYEKKQIYKKTKLNNLFNYWNFFDEKEIDIQKITKETLETILYSKYFWCSRFKDQYIRECGQDVGLEQQQYKILEELEQRLDGNINWQLIQKIEENKV